ncbi:MAG: hypothetical protein ACR2P8_11825 [Myxococcota bacterium]
MDERQDIYSGRQIEWRWIGVGVLVVTGLTTLLAAVAAAIGINVASLRVLLLLTTLAFGLGGAVVGLLSPGYTAWEAGIASLLAAAAAILLASRLLEFAEGLLVVLPVAGLWGLLCGLAGGYLGERLQSSRDAS